MTSWDYLGAAVNIAWFTVWLVRILTTTEDNIKSDDRHRSAKGGNHYE
jgi:hypothetical protein